MDQSYDHLAHYGVKGMHWGVRKKRGVQTDVVVNATPGKRLKAKGGHNAPASEDAKKTIKIRQQARKSTTDSLSNQELQTLVTRMNLEQQYTRLSSQDKSLGRQMADKLLKDTMDGKMAESLSKVQVPNKTKPKPSPSGTVVKGRVVAK